MSNFEVLGFINISDDPRYRTLERDGTTSANPEERMTGLKCRGCGRGMAIVEEMCFRNYQPGSGEVLWRANFAWPLPTAQVSDDVPEAIAGIYREAVTALAARIPRAAAMMARATMEAITKDQGETNPGHNFKQRIDRLVTNGKLQAQLGDWAHQIRLLGNVGAHDPTAAVDLKDVAQLIAFIEQLFKYLYEMPAELSRRMGTS